MIVRLGIKTKQERIIQGENKSCPKKEYLQKCQINFNGCYDFINDRSDYNHFKSFNRKIIDKDNRSVSLITSQQYDNLNFYLKDFKLSYGDLGENITINNIQNIELNEGKIIQIGDVQLQLTERMKPCHRLSYYDNLIGKYWWRRDNSSDISKYINSNDNRGWYCKVIKVGIINENDNLNII